MWARRISSGTSEHPTPKDVFRLLLSRLLERGIESSWIHLEVIAEGSWLKNILSGKQPWIEIAFVNQQSLQLNPGLPKKKAPEMPPLPEKWRIERKGLWNVPLSDIEELIDWIHDCLAVASGNANYQVSGWIEGL